MNRSGAQVCPTLIYIFLHLKKFYPVFATENKSARFQTAKLKTNAQLVHRVLPVHQVRKATTVSPAKMVPTVSTLSPPPHKDMNNQRRKNGMSIKIRQ